MVFSLLAAGTAWSAGRYLPSLRFHTLTTPHFVIYYHQGEERLARQLAGVAEAVYRDLTARLRTTPSGRTHVVLVNQDDAANGWATPLPYNTIEVAAAWPSTADLIGNTTDWLRLVFAHEFTHILQLDRSAGVAGFARRLFGRSPLAFANLALPSWQIEGLATFEESATSGRGRIPAGAFRALVDEAARAGRAEPLDRASGLQADWPSGITPYAYGGYFFEYLARRYGDAKLADLLAATARRFYFLQASAFDEVFGRSLGDLWREFAAKRATEAPGPGGTPVPDERELGLQQGPRGRGARPQGTSAPVRITFHGFTVRGPRFLRPAHDPLTVLYALQDAHDFPSLRRVAIDGTGDGRLESGYLGQSLGVAGNRVWFSQLDLHASVALRSDLYTLDLENGRTVRATEDGRYLDPDVSPDGRTLVAVSLDGGDRSLAFLSVGGDRAAPNLRVERALRGGGRQYSSPRWSPDGRFVAASAVGPGDRSAIVIVPAPDAGGGEGLEAGVVVSSTGGRNVTPAWTPDGTTVVFASDAEGGPFNLYAVDLSASAAGLTSAALYRLPPVAGGASQPDVSPDGSRLVFVGYTPAGYDLFAAPFDRSAWERLDSCGTGGAEPDPDRDRDLASPGPQGAVFDCGDVARSLASPVWTPEVMDAREAPYSPLPTLLPRYWMPTIGLSDTEVEVGAATATADVLDRHRYAAALSFRFARDAASGLAYDGAPDWSLSYAYARWRPTLYAGASSATSLFPEQPRADAVRRVRDREWVAGVVAPFARLRRSQALRAEMSLSERMLTATDGRTASRLRNAARLAWTFSTAHRYGYSIGPEQGVVGAVTSEHVRRALGADGNADQATAELRGYLRLGGRHATLASRLAVGLASGDQGVRRQFYLGGPGPLSSLVDFGTGTFGLLRGFDDRALAGSRVATLSLEYRVPILRIERGRGTWPLFVRTLHGAAFFDAGNAFEGAFAARALKRAYGAEVSLDVVLGHALPLTCTAGVAVPRDPSSPGRLPTRAYVRVGHAF